MAATPSCPAPHDIGVWHAHIDQVWPSAASRDRGLHVAHARRACPLRSLPARRRPPDVPARPRDGAHAGRPRAGDAPPPRGRGAKVAHGRPEIDVPRRPCRFNLAHSAGLVVCALARGREVGVDVEDLQRAGSSIRTLVDRYCSPAEVRTTSTRRATDGWRDRFLTYWTLKEAYLKARGLGISVPPLGHQLRGALDGQRARSTFSDRSPGPIPAGRSIYARSGDGHLVAVAASTPRNVRPTFSLDPFPPTGYRDGQPDEAGWRREAARHQRPAPRAPGQPRGAGRRSRPSSRTTG